MDFFRVFWFDLLLLLAVLPEVVRFFLPGPRFRFLSAIGIGMQLASIAALLFLGASLFDLLVVLMLFAAVSSGLLCLETRLRDRRDAGKEPTP